MDHYSEMQNQSANRSNCELEAAREQDRSLESLDARLQELENRVQELKTGSPLPWPASRTKIFDAALDLRVKVDAVRWMLRVSKHLDGPARERVLLTIANSLAQLEKAVAPAIRAA